MEYPTDRANQESVGPAHIDGHQPTPQTHHPGFHGDASEYFRIWIVNMLLSLLTVGIYSA